MVPGPAELHMGTACMVDYENSYKGVMFFRQNYKMLLLSPTAFATGEVKAILQYNTCTDRHSFM